VVGRERRPSNTHWRERESERRPLLLAPKTRSGGYRPRIQSSFHPTLLPPGDATTTQPSKSNRSKRNTSKELYLPAPNRTEKATLNQELAQISNCQVLTTHLLKKEYLLLLEKVGQNEGEGPTAQAADSIALPDGEVVVSRHRAAPMRIRRGARAISWRRSNSR
jgi:hypothetical protein